ncbi:hypothetical protein E4T49_02291 [Aureobasidium sp. EXF-10728]|nr:hypothetical protein E4T49_02291 [Aureobasidium sp. EXF-10728]
MSIASPRPSLNLPSSRRGSTSTINSTRSPSTSRPSSIRNNSTTSTSTNTPVPAASRRRDRAALREFYNLQASADTKPPPTASTLTPIDSEPTDALASLDTTTFAPNPYVEDLLATSDAETLLRRLNAITISALGLEGDKKALVYDNYTTLLSATSTISGLVENDAPMATLEPAVKHIADVAVSIAGSRGVGLGDKERQREMVRWVLGAPERLRGLKEQEKEEEMQKEWDRVRGLLEKWEGVKGVEEVRRQCHDVVGKD